jgi:hypothetical protein
LNLTRLHLGIAHESQFQGLGITGSTWLNSRQARFCMSSITFFLRRATGRPRET